MYLEEKQKIDNIRTEYAAKFDFLFRLALDYLMQTGTDLFEDKEWLDKQFAAIDKKHDEADINRKTLFMTRRFEKGIVECAVKLSKVNRNDLLIYIQRELYLGGEGLNYQRAIKLLKNCMSFIEEQSYETNVVLNTFESIGFTDEELSDLGYEYLTFSDE